MGMLTALTRVWTPVKPASLDAVVDRIPATTVRELSRRVKAYGCRIRETFIEPDAAQIERNYTETAKWFKHATDEERYQAELVRLAIRQEAEESLIAEHTRGYKIGVDFRTNRPLYSREIDRWGLCPESSLGARALHRHRFDDREQREAYERLMLHAPGLTDEPMLSDTALHESTPPSVINDLTYEDVMVFVSSSGVEGDRDKGRLPEWGRQDRVTSSRIRFNLLGPFVIRHYK